MAELDFLILANHVEVQNGLLYMNGGGWSDHHRGVLAGSPPPVSTFGIAVGVLVPWSETNVPHQLSVGIEDEDGASVAQLGASLTTGRPPELPPGADQRAVMAMMFNLQFQRPGEYRIVARLGDQSPRMTTFRVHDHPVQSMAA